MTKPESKAPKLRAIVVPPGRITLRGLVADGLEVSQFGRGGPTTVVRFQQVGKPYRVNERTGWYAVKVASEYGGVSTMLYVPDTDDVSGRVNLRRGGKE